MNALLKIDNVLTIIINAKLSLLRFQRVATSMTQPIIMKFCIHGTRSTEKDMSCFSSLSSQFFVTAWVIPRGTSS